MRQLIMVSTILVLSGHVGAQDNRFPSDDERTALWSARACWFEGEFSFNDCAAILHVIRKRSAMGMKMPFLEMLTRYSTVSSQQKRAKIARTLFFGSILSMTSTWNNSWMKLHDFVKTVLRDEVEDPCPSAVHWGSVTDPPKPDMVKVRCNKPVHNIFYRTVRFASR